MLPNLALVFVTLTYLLIFGEISRIGYVVYFLVYFGVLVSKSITEVISNGHVVVN